QREFMRETDMLRNDIFHFTEKRPDGSTDLFAFTDFDSSVIRNGSSLYNAYKIGKLGATPDLQDTYIPVD
ncbi:MAG: ATP-binding protein, partial [Saprospiraceae bacterium]